MTTEAMKREAVALCGLLTPSELETLVYSAKGFDSHQIGAAMGRSHRTVEGYRRNVMEKFDVATTIEAAVIAARAGVV